MKKDEIRLNISKTKWIEAKALDDGLGVKILLVDDRTNNFVSTLGGAVRSSGKDCVLLTFTSDARQMRTRIKCGKVRIPVSAYNLEKSFAISLESGDIVVVSPAFLNSDCAVVRVYMQKKSFLYPLVEFSVDVYSNDGKIDRVILGREIPCRNQEILYGYDIVNL